MTEERKILEPSDIPGLTTLDADGFCMDRGTLRFVNESRAKKGIPLLTKDFLDWEKEIALPALEAAGYSTLGIWKNGEADSFGPLSRYLVVRKDDEYFTFCYD